MNLTKTDKDAFVRAVMADVPRVDYNEKARALLSAWDREAMPAPVRAIWDDVSLRRFLSHDFYHSNPKGLNGISTVALRPTDLVPAVVETLAELAEGSLAQRVERDKLERELGSLLAPFRTLAAAKKGLPEELHKYLPADRDATGVTNLPAGVSPVDLLKAMGWPK